MHVETENPKKALKKKITNKIENHLNDLKESNAIHSCMVLNSAPSLLTQWKVVQQNLPENIFVLSRKALIFSLANKTNLLRWKISPNDLCEMCSNRLLNMESSGNVINHVPRSTRVRESRSLKQRPLPQLPVVIGVHKWSDYKYLYSVSSYCRVRKLILTSME